MHRCSLGLVARAWIVWCLAVTPIAAKDPPSPDTTFGDSLVREYLAQETRQATEDCLADIQTLDDWTARREGYRRQLFDMLGLDPLPEKTPLQPVITGTVEHPEFIVEKLHFQSRPGLYVTGNLYRPRTLDKPAPTILYVCGHGRVVQDGVSLGNKTSYQHHGEWFARNGYVCLTIDTIQLGEIEGLHHGTYREKMWWWHSRGYTPAGVEAWNCIRALDYLETRPEVDTQRIGVTGRSGGGAYSWWIAALDDRIQVAVPVAGITSLQNHIVDNCIEGHCDCMFMVNTYGWDFPLLAALVAPRPLLISNTDKDRIFPLDGVYDVYVKTRRIYDLYKASDRLGLHITEGPHKDTQELRAHAFVWFDRFLRKEPRELDTAAPKLLEPAQLKVFAALPTDEKVTTAHEWFVPAAPTPPVPASTAEWDALKSAWLARLADHVLDDCPAEPAPMEYVVDVTADGVRIYHYRLYPDDVYPLDLYVALPDSSKQPPAGLTLELLDQAAWEALVPQLRSASPVLVRGLWPTSDAAAPWQPLAAEIASSGQARAWFVPRGIGPTEWTRDDKRRSQILRRFALLGQTADELRTYDAVQAVRAVRGLPEMTVDLSATPLTVTGQRDAAGWALYAALLEPNVQQLDLVHPPRSHDRGPIYLNVLRYFDIPQAVALAAEQRPVALTLDAQSAGLGDFARATARQLGWGADRVTSKADATGDDTPKAGGK